MKIFQLALLSVLLLSITSCKNNGAGASDSSGATKTPAGYEYTHVVKNEGATPKQGDLVRFHFKVVDDKGKMRFNSWDAGQPTEFKMPAQNDKLAKDPVISTLFLMAKGDSLVVNYPVDSMPTKPADLDGVKSFAYHLKMIDIVSPEEQAKAKEVNDKVAAEKKAQVDQILKDYKSGKLKSNIKKQPSGLEIYTVEEGDGPTPQAGQKVKVNYYGVLKENGVMFDNSFSRGQPFEFTLGRGQVIPGWDQGLALLKKGSKAVLFIPYAMAYGEAGSPPVIPAKADLVFYVELLDVK